jgi:hypothetical protein
MHDRDETRVARSILSIHQKFFVPPASGRLYSTARRGKSPAETLIKSGGKFRQFEEKVPRAKACVGGRRTKDVPVAEKLPHHPVYQHGAPVAWPAAPGDRHVRRVAAMWGLSADLQFHEELHMFGKSRIASMAVTAAVSGLVGGAALTSVGCSSSGSAGNTATTSAAPATHDCQGKNACKGQGGCKTGDQGCKGKNSCKGKGGCKVT